MGKRGRKKTDKESVRLNLSLDINFNEQLSDLAEKDFLSTSTWVVQYLKKNLINK